MSWLNRPLARVVYGFIWALGFVFYHMPFGLKRLLARAGASVFFSLIRFRRQIVLHNLALVFPRTPGETMASLCVRQELLAKKNYEHYVLCLFEVLERFHWRDADLNRRFRIVGGDDLRECVAGGRGFFFLTAHIGNWELISRVGLILKLPLSIISKYLRNPFFNELWAKARTSYGLELLDEEGSAVRVMKSIRRGRAVGFILDQHIGPPHGVPAEFLKHEALCPQGLAVMAPRLGCPILPAYLIREPNGTFTLYLEPALDFAAIYADRSLFDGKQLTDAGIRAHVELCNRNMESYVRRFPEQYLWLHKRFKNRLDYSSPLPW